VCQSLFAALGLHTMTKTAGEARAPGCRLGRSFKQAKILRAGARIKLMRCIELGGSEVDSSKLQTPPPGSKPLSDPFGSGQLSDGLASPSILGKVS
jgi:hypothetical protein